MIFETGIGLERVSRAAYLALFASLNAEIAVQTSTWAPLDEEVGQIKGVVTAPIYLEQIDSGNFHQGHRPSLIEAPIEEYPNVSVMAYQGNPSDDQSDQFDNYIANLFVEIMVKAQAPDILEDRQAYHRAEEEVNARAQRTAEAAHNVLARDRTLGGAVSDLETPPSVALTDVFTRRQERVRGPVFLWQGARIELEFEKQSQW